MSVNNCYEYSHLCLKLISFQGVSLHDFPTKSAIASINLLTCWKLNMFWKASQNCSQRTCKQFLGCNKECLDFSESHHQMAVASSTTEDMKMGWAGVPWCEEVSGIWSNTIASKKLLNGKYHIFYNIQAHSSADMFPAD